MNPSDITKKALSKTALHGGISIEDLRTLIEFQKQGTFQKAALSLGKAHTAILHSFAKMEKIFDFQILNRGEYRSSLNTNGLRLCQSAEEVLGCFDRFMATASWLKGGWESELSVVFDGVVSPQTLMKALEDLKKENIPTRFQLSMGHLRDIESQFLENRATFMIGLLDPENFEFSSIPLKPIDALLVTSSKHSLAKKNVGIDDLKSHTLVTIRGSDNRLGLSTRGLDRYSSFLVTDFSTKRAALLANAGYGWMPRYLIEQDLKNKKLIPLESNEFSTNHQFLPKLYWNRSQTLGSAASAFRSAICG